MFVTPRYGDGALTDLVPSVLGVLGVAGESDRIGLGVDGSASMVEKVRAVLRPRDEAFVADLVEVELPEPVDLVVLDIEMPVMSGPSSRVKAMATRFGASRSWPKVFNT